MDRVAFLCPAAVLKRLQVESFTARCSLLGPLMITAFVQERSFTDTRVTPDPPEHSHKRSDL